MRGYPRPGPRYTWTSWWSPVLIANEDVPTEEELRAEDEAIAAMERGPQPQAADIVSLMEALTGGRQAETEGLAEQDRWDGHRGA